MSFRDRTRPSSILSALAPDKDPEVSEKTIIRKSKPIVAARWRLCFQTDPAKDVLEFSPASGSSSSGHVPMPQQQQQQPPQFQQMQQHQPNRHTNHEPLSFFVTIVDPKPPSKPLQQSQQGDTPRSPEATPESSTFASPFACSVANTLIGRRFLQTLPHHSWQGLGAVLLGKETVAAGLAIAMIGAKAALLAEKRYWQATQRNAQLFCRDSVDYGHFLAPNVVAVRGPCTNLSLCEKLRVAGMLDLVVITAPSLQRFETNEATSKGSDCGQALFDHRPLLEILEDLAPATASIETRVLLLYEGRQAAQTDASSHGAGEEEGDQIEEVRRWFSVPRGWRLRPCDLGFCDPGCRGVWLLRKQAPDQELLGGESRLSVSSSATGRSLARLPLAGPIPIPPCGVGGFPAKPLPPLDGSSSSASRRQWEIPPWYENVQRVKQALLDHNDQKQSDSKAVLSQARAWSTRARFHSAKSRSSLSSSSSSLTSGPPRSASTRKPRKRFLRDGEGTIFRGYASWHNFSVSTAVSTQVLDLPEEADFQLLDQVQDALQEPSNLGYDQQSQCVRPLDEVMGPLGEAEPADVSGHPEDVRPPRPLAHSAPVEASVAEDEEDGALRWPCPSLAAAAAELDAEAATYHLQASEDEVLAALNKAIALDRKYCQPQNRRLLSNPPSTSDRRPVTTGSTTSW
eukprot:CAMPEP_0206572292 /NCGR_PEP_ID=MMETSP0325_2-20121206/28154_1 /ASSEMBLY_ACC=CAM_ASM_000347 /TAXON_ID=2866 /ORGANISM="Crypthecodinium cohnii, Strain Seligo" /LENGTH=683 /DNA_ID=CAMNT_0054076459 /DNA_START=130 /DNA_END=2178 /DNA_ORIENTATION=-